MQQIRVLGAAVLVALTALVPWQAHHAAAATAVPCAGHLLVSPGVVGIGGKITLQGSKFNCKLPNGHRFPRPFVMMYRQGLGFAGFNVRTQPNGTYSLTTAVPAHLTPVSALNGGKHKPIPTAPGVYYFTVGLYSIDLPPPKLAMAHITITR